MTGSTAVRPLAGHGHLIAFDMSGGVRAARHDRRSVAGLAPAPHKSSPASALVAFLAAAMRLGRVLTTQIYFPGERQNDRDGLFQKELLMTLKDSAAGKAGRFHFMLERA